ncbi:MBL fold metallo-hydrolase [Pedobacter puniceum]|uniref:MBL fold metallo-hydrolase n=1 Tax=Pedobacter puniceum TaxID=2666136 RepID=A0A7K0FQV8_9SPHI|nr:MBL fold metallo-hydrolase [Pedobacter puniceum]MRX48354.1 MBL fold metallo-hydrolase [Pedobacter puniceum]
MKLHTIDTGFFKLDGGAMFGVVPKAIWNKTNPADENNLCTWAMRCLLIEDGDKLILVDNGIGDKQDEKFLSHYHLHGDATLDNSLAKLGYSKDDITDVILTHLHFDHCGGSIVKEGTRLVPAFKNATFWSNQQHWEWAVSPNAREKASFLKENILPIQESGQLKFIPVEDGYAFSENIKIRFAFGHTDAMMLPEIHIDDTTFLYMADLLPSVGHIPQPYVMSYDMFPLKTLEEKKRILELAEKNNYILILEHDPLHECCTLQITEKGIRLHKTFDLKDYKQQIV